MKSKSRKVGVGLVSLGVLSLVSSCSSLPGSSESGKDIASNGPTVLNARAEPSTVELTHNLLPVQRPEILADVKDFGSKVSRVTLKFNQVPVEVPMENIGGTTWRAELTPKQLRSLAVSGKTITYEATVEAKDEKGQIATSSSPVTVAIKAPNLSRAVG